MIKLVALIPMRRDITRERFHIHWRYPHGELARNITTFRRYVQSHRIGAVDPGLGPSPYEGAAEIWFDSLEVALQLGEEPTYAEHVGPDERNFIDLDTLAYLFTDEEVIVEGPVPAVEEGGVKLVHCVRRPADLSVEEFRERWTADDSELATELGAIRHARCLPLQYHYEQGDAVYDGVRELRWADLPSFQEARAAANGAWSQLTNPAVVDAAGSSAMLVEEFRIIWP